MFSKFYKIKKNYFINYKNSLTLPFKIKIMSKQKIKDNEKYISEEVLHTLDETAIQSEKFLEKHAKTIAIVFGGILLLTFGYFAYLKFIVEPKNNEAFKEMTNAQVLFVKDSLEQSLGGKSGVVGFEDIISNYSGTDAANLANYYAGIAYYEKGDFQKALEKFQSFSTSDETLNSITQGAIGDCYVELGKDDDALSQFEKAANSKIAFVSFNFNKKAGILAMQLGKNKEALGFFNAVKEKFPEESEDFPELDAYIEMLTYKNGNN